MTLDERNKMVEENQNLVWFVIKYWYPTYYPNEDLYQTGIIGLIRAVDNYDEEKGSFSHFAIICIRTELMNEFKRRNKQPPTLSMDAVSTGDDERTIAEKLPSDEVVDISVLDICDGILTEQEAEVFYYVANGGILADLAKERGVSRQSLSQVYRKACARLKFALREE